MQVKNNYCVRTPTPDSYDDEEEHDEDVEIYNTYNSKNGPVDLYISNLDYNISSREWRKILATTFQPNIQVPIFFFTLCLL